MSTTTSIRSRNALAELLATRIADGELRPGDLLPSERVLAEQFGVSRSLVREALRTLVERRLIQVEPGRGSVVRETTLADAVERMKEIFDHSRVTPRTLIEARSMIETTAAGLAAERADAAELAAIEQAHRSCDQAQSLVEQVRWDLGFHLAIVRAAKNPLVQTMFHAIQPYIVELLFRSLTDSTIADRGLAFHWRIVDAIIRRDAETAAREMSEHLRLGITLFGADLDRNLNLVAQEALRSLSGGVTFEEVIRLSREP